MDIYDKLHPVGHLQIIKKHNSTGEEEVIFDEDNLICSGLGQSMAQFMSIDCARYVPSGCPWTEAATIFQDSPSDRKYTISGTGDDIAFTIGGGNTGLGGEVPGFSGWQDCYCEEQLWVTIELTFEEGGSVIHSTIEVMYGAGCVKEDDQACSIGGSNSGWSINDSRDENGDGYVSITKERCINWGKCDIGAPEVIEGVTPLTDPCQFVWGQAGARFVETADCEEASSTLCRPPGYTRSIVAAVEGYQENPVSSLDLLDGVEDAALDDMGVDWGFAGGRPDICNQGAGDSK